MNEYRIDIKVRNNLILKKIEEAGYKNLGELCSKNNIKFKYSTINSILNMKKSPLDCSGNFNSSIVKLCEIIKCSPDELFTETQINTSLSTNKRTLEVKEAEMKYLLENSKEPKLLEENYYENQLNDNLEKSLSRLSPREEKIIKLRFYENKTLKEIGKELNITGSRVRAIEVEALKKLRHPIKNKNLREFF